MLSTRSVPEGIDPNTGRLISVGTGFQVRIEFEGVARLDYLQVFQAPTGLHPYSDNPEAGSSAGEVSVPAGAVEPSFWHAHPVSPLAGIV
jgi:hypothetical protein